MTEAENAALEHNYNFESLNNIMIGDIDKNNSIDVIDALEILYMSARLANTYYYTADMTNDGIVNAQDALEVLKIAAKITE